MSYYPTDAVGALRATAVNLVGFGTALMTGALISRKIAHALAERALRLGTRLPEHGVVAAFLLVGVLASSVPLTADMGVRPGVVSGIVRSLSRFALVAVFIAASYRGLYASALRFSAIAVTAIESTPVRPHRVSRVACTVEREISLSRFRPSLILEVGDFLVDGAPASAEVVEWLVSRGYAPHEFVEGVLRPHSPQKRYGYGNLLFLPTGS